MLASHRNVSTLAVGLDWNNGSSTSLVVHEVSFAELWSRRRTGRWESLRQRSTVYKRCSLDVDSSVDIADWHRNWHWPVLGPWVDIDRVRRAPAFPNRTRCYSIQCECDRSISCSKWDSTVETKIDPEQWFHTDNRDIRLLAHRRLDCWQSKNESLMAHASSTRSLTWLSTTISTAAWSIPNRVLWLTLGTVAAFRVTRRSSPVFRTNCRRKGINWVMLVVLAGAARVRAAAQKLERDDSFCMGHCSWKVRRS